MSEEFPYIVRLHTDKMSEEVLHNFKQFIRENTALRTSILEAIDAEDRRILTLCHVSNKLEPDHVNGFRLKLVEQELDLTNRKFIDDLQHADERFLGVMSLIYNKTEETRLKQIVDSVHSERQRDLKKFLSKKMEIFNKYYSIPIFT